MKVRTMTTTIKPCNLFESQNRTFVCTVNVVGAMGKGIALEFRNRYPDLYYQYKKLCRQKKFKPHSLFKMVSRFGNQHVICLVTKEHFARNSNLDLVESSLKLLVDYHKNVCSLGSLAIPPLGCSNGGLDFESQVKPLMLKYLSELDIDVEICTNEGS